MAMLHTNIFVFNEIQENTYVLYDETLECVIIDAGCNNPAEEQRLSDYISQKHLKPVALLNTHGHFDHVLGNAYVSKKYGLSPQMHRADLPILERTETYVASFGLSVEMPPMPTLFLEDGQVIRFGDSEMSVLYTPGHSPGGVCFYSEKDKLLIAGDTLFRGSIGRTDLPGGDYDELISSIHTKLLVLPSDTQVFCGHGPSTAIGIEAATNPFLND